VAVAGPGSGSPLVTVELRHAGGALETLERGFLTHAAGMPADAASAAAIEAQLALVAAAAAPYSASRPTWAADHADCGNGRCRHGGGWVPILAGTGAQPTSASG